MYFGRSWILSKRALQLFYLSSYKGNNLNRIAGYLHIPSIFLPPDKIFINKLKIRLSWSTSIHPNPKAAVLSLSKEKIPIVWAGFSGFLMGLKV